MNKVLPDNKIDYMSKIYDLNKMTPAVVRELAEKIGEMRAWVNEDTQRRLEVLQRFCYDYANSREEK